MGLGKILAIVGAGAACVITGGLAAPAIGAAVGATMGLSGAAATSAGLAALGGGALAAGGAGVAGGTMLIQAVAGGLGVLGAGIATNAADGAKAKKQNKELRDALRQHNVDSATKQKLIAQLNATKEERDCYIKEHPDFMNEYPVSYEHRELLQDKIYRGLMRKIRDYEKSREQ